MAKLNKKIITKAKCGGESEYRSENDEKNCAAEL